MASAWGKAWASAWGNSWGAIAPAIHGAGGGKSKTSQNKYRLIRADQVDFENVEQLTDYLAEKIEEAQTKTVKVKRKRGRAGSQYVPQAPPLVRFNAAPGHYREIVELYIQRANAEIARIWGERIRQKLEDQEDEESLVLLMGA